MTYKDFKKKIREVSAEVYKPTSFHPLQHGIQRATFEEQKLKRLIAIGRRASFETARNRVAAWERQLVRVQQTRQRLMNTRDGIFIALKREPTQLQVSHKEENFQPAVSSAALNRN